MTDRKTIERLTRDILTTDTRYRTCTNQSAKSIATGLVSMGWAPSVVHQCCEDAEKYRPRTIETVDQLKELPEWTVVLTEQGGVFQWDGDTWMETGDDVPHRHEDLSLPVTVLHTPKETP